MFPKISFLSVFILFFTSFSFSQILDVEEKKPVMENGIEYGYIVKNEQQKKVKGEEYARFEITLYATNKSGCTRLYAENNSFLSSGPDNLLATFNCNNANGKRLTAKSGTVLARVFYVNVKIKEDKKDDEKEAKEISKSVKAGYIFRNNETVQNNIIVLLPPGERPDMQCVINQLNELR